MTTPVAKKFSCQCMRCNGTGKYDRGTCFGCAGTGMKNQATKPRALTAFQVTVTYTNGKVDTPTLYATRRENAVEIISRYCRIKGWAVKEIV